MKSQSFHASRRQVQSTNQITGERRWWALAAVMISMFFSSLDQTVVSTALPTIISDLGGLKLYAWIFSAYILATSVTIPIYGRLSDTFGRKPFYVFGLIVFLAGSAVSGAAHSMGMLIAARAVQGIGGGALMSIPRATIGDIFNPRERGRWMGVVMSVFALASLIGPALGGWFTDRLSWRWVFYINIPVALVALGMVLYALPTVRTETKHKLDWPGSLLLAAGVIPMLLGFTWGGTTYPWGSWQIVGLFVVAAVALTAFVFNERRAAEPVIEMSFFKNRTFSTTMVIGFLAMITMFSAMLFLPLFVQGVLGISAEHAGYILTPMMLTFILASMIVGQTMSRTGRYKLQAIIGGGFLIVGAWLLTRLTPTTTWPSVVVDMIVLGMGIGSLMPVIGTVIQNIFPYRMLGTVNATQQAVQSLAGAIAAPIFGTVMANRFAQQLPTLLPARLTQAFAHLPPAERSFLNNPQGLASASAQAALQKQFSTLGPAADQLYHQFITALHQALTSAMTGVYSVGLVFAAIAFVATFLLREMRLKQEEFYSGEGEGAGAPSASHGGVAAAEGETAPVPEASAAGGEGPAAPRSRRPVVAIAADYGAGGGEIGRALAESLGVPLIERAIPPTIVEQVSELLKQTFEEEELSSDAAARLFGELGSTSQLFGLPSEPHTEGPLSVQEYRRMAHEALDRLAATSGAVVVGHGAAAALRGAPGCLRVSVRAPLGERIARVAEHEGLSQEAARKKVAAADAARHAFMRHLYEVEPEDPDLYHIVLDSSVVPTEVCVSTLLSLLPKLASE